MSVGSSNSWTELKDQDWAVQDHQELQRVTTRTKEPPPPYSSSWQ